MTVLLSLADRFAGVIEVYFIHRSEKSLQVIEKAHGIRRRWPLESPTFLHSKQNLNAKRRSVCLLQMHAVAAERAFLLEMKKKICRYRKHVIFRSLFPCVTKVYRPFFVLSQMDKPLPKNLARL